MANTPISSLSNGGITLPSDDTLVNRGGVNYRTQMPVSSAYVGSTFTRTSSTTLTNITALSLNVTAGGVYIIEACLLTTSAVTGGVKAAIGGTATATSIGYEGQTEDGGAAAVDTQSRSTALGTAVGAVTAVTLGTVTIRGAIVVNAAGTLTVQVGQNVSDGTGTSVLVGSWFKLTQVS